MSDGEQWYVFQSQRQRDAAFPARVVFPVTSVVLQSCVSVWQQCDCLFKYFVVILSPWPLLVEQPRDHCRGGLAYFMPLRSTWLAAISMTLMMKAMAKAHIRLLRTHVCLTCCVGLEPAGGEREERYWQVPRMRPWSPGDVFPSPPNERAHHKISRSRGRVIIRRALFSHLFAAARLKVWLEFFSKQIAARLSGVLKAAYQLIAAMSQINRKKVFK